MGKHILYIHLARKGGTDGWSVVGEAWSVCGTEVNQLGNGAVESAVNRSGIFRYLLCFILNKSKSLTYLQIISSRTIRTISFWWVSLKISCLLTNWKKESRAGLQISNFNLK
jgi:hypothetical protein